MAADPTEAEVLAWMTRTGGTAADAVQHFWGVRPGDPDYKRRRDRVNQQASRARRAGRSDAPPPAAAPPLATPNRSEPSSAPPDGWGRPPADLDTARLDKVPFLEWQLSELLADLAWARAGGRLDYAAKIDARVSDVRQQLDMARAEGGRVVSLERSPAAVADEVERRAARIRELAARAADGREREL